MLQRAALLVQQITPVEYPPSMPRFLADFFQRLDAPYEGQPYFAREKARLLAGFILLVLLVILPINQGKILWAGMSHPLLRMGSNVLIALAGAASLRLLLRGRLVQAGTGFAVGLLAPPHVLVFLSLPSREPLSIALQLACIDIMAVLLAVVYASRWVAFLLFGFVIASHLVLYSVATRTSPILGSVESAYDILLREGLETFGVVLVICITIIRLIETAHHRSAQALSESRAINAKLEFLVAERTAELSRLNEEKNTFLGMAAHDLRSPLAKIRMIVDIIEAERDYSAPRVRADLATIADTSTRMLGLLNSLLDVTAIEEGRISLHPERVDARALVREVHGDFRELAAAKEIELLLAPPESLAPAALPALLDPAAIRQVLHNLVSNALKYSPAGRRVWLSAEPGPAGSVRFVVRDEGPGLSAADQAKLFGKFSRLSAKPTGGERSTGLGLSIVKRLVQEMAGTVAIASTVGEGTTFVVEFPSEPAKPVGLDSRPASQPLAIGT